MYPLSRSLPLSVCLGNGSELHFPALALPLKGNGSAKYFEYTAAMLQPAPAPSHSHSSVYELFCLSFWYIEPTAIFVCALSTSHTLFSTLLSVSFTFCGSLALRLFIQMFLPGTFRANCVCNLRHFCIVEMEYILQLDEEGSGACWD